MVTKRRWKDSDVLAWATYYLSHNVVLIDMERIFGVSHSTIWWNFQHRLPKLDVTMYDLVLERLDQNKREHVYRKGM